MNSRGSLESLSSMEECNRSRAAASSPPLTTTLLPPSNTLLSILSIPLSVFALFAYILRIITTFAISSHTACPFRGQGLLAGRATFMSDIVST